MSFSNVSAPFQGINARDPINLLRPTEALDLVNIVPFPGKLQLRKGYTPHSTGFVAPPESLFTYNNFSGASKVFAGTSAGIFDSTAPGAVGASVATSTQGQWDSVNFATAANVFLVATNGTDPLLLYNGTTWQQVTGVSAPIAITGVVTSTLIRVTSFKQRLHYLQKDSSSFFFTPVGQVGGAATEFPLGQYLTRGGFLLEQVSWTVDGGAGLDDLYVVISSEGEVLVFSGTDPAAPATWSLQGLFQLPRPLGPNSLLKFGGDVLVLTEAGIFPLSKSLLNVSIRTDSAITDKINPLFTELSKTQGPGWLWQLFSYPAGPFIICNTPDVSGQQFVFNIQSKAWTRFNGLKAKAFALANGVGYMALADSVVVLFNSATDNGVSIFGKAITAPLHFAGQAGEAQVDALRAVFLSTASLSYGVLLLTNLTIDQAQVQYVAGLQGGSLWGGFNWDDAFWAGSSEVVRSWITPPNSPSPEVSLALIMTTVGEELTWLSTDFLTTRVSSLS